MGLHGPHGVSILVKAPCCDASTDTVPVWFAMPADFSAQPAYH